jgi:flagellar motor protein MotB
MWMFIGLLSFFATVFFVITAIISAFKKNGTAKKKFMIAGALFVVLIAAVAADSDDGEPAEQVAQATTTNSNELATLAPKESEKIVEKKAEEEKQAKAAEEEKRKTKEKADAKAKADAEKEEAKAEAKEKAEKEAKEKEEAKKIPGTLGMTPTQFMVAFNESAEEFDSTLRIKNIKLEVGSLQNSFQHMFTENLGVIGTVNKQDNSVRDVLILGSGNGLASSGMDIFIAMGILIAATNPELAPDERGDILRDLGLMDENTDILNIDASTIRNGIRYNISGSEQIGIMFSVGDANDK